jgi:hypothetical protein
LFDTYYAETKFLQSAVYFFCWRVAWQVSDHSLYWLQGFGIEGERFWKFGHCLMAEKSAISFVTTLAPVLVFQKSKLPLTKPSSCFCNWIKFVADVSIMGGGLPLRLLGGCWSPSSSACFLVSSADSSCMPAVFRGAKKSRVGCSGYNDIRGSLVSVVGLAAFLSCFCTSSETPFKSPLLLEPLVFVDFLLVAMVGLYSLDHFFVDGCVHAHQSCEQRLAIQMLTQDAPFGLGFVCQLFPDRAIPIYRWRCLDKLPYFNKRFEYDGYFLLGIRVFFQQGVMLPFKGRMHLTLLASQTVGSICRRTDPSLVEFGELLDS